jgi:uncharacterized membrane protein
MKKRSLIFIILMVFLALTLVSASTYEREYTQVGNKIVIKESIDNIKISNYVSSNVLEKSSKGYYFVEKIVFNESYSSAIIKINLQEGIILEDYEAYPAGYSIDSDGKTISLIWAINNVQKNQVFAIFIKLEDTSRFGFGSILFMGLIILVFLISSYFIYKKFRLSKTIKPQKKKVKTAKKISLKETKYDYLLDTEKKVIEELKKADRNELWQKQIQNSTGFSKAKVSRLVRNLESRGLISKIPFGNTNKIRLK